MFLRVRMDNELSSHQDMEVNESLSDKHLKVIINSLTFLWRRSLSYRN